MTLVISHIKQQWSAPAGDWPDETNTGFTSSEGSLIAVPGTATSGVGWAWDGESVRVTSAGATFSGYNVSGYIVVTANNVTVTNCKVTIDDEPFFAFYADSVSGVTLSDCTFIAPSDVGGAGISVIRFDACNNCDVLRNNTSGGENGIFIGATNMLIQDNYVHDLSSESLSEAHTDGIQLFGGNECAGTQVIHNNVLSLPGDATSAIITGSNENLFYNNNRFYGGYSVMRVCNDSTNTYTNNRMGGYKGENVGGSDWFPTTADTDGPNGGNATWSGNIDDDTEEEIEAPW